MQMLGGRLNSPEGLAGRLGSHESAPGALGTRLSSHASSSEQQWSAGWPPGLERGISAFERPSASDRCTRRRFRSRSLNPSTAAGLASWPSSWKHHGRMPSIGMLPGYLGSRHACIGKLIGAVRKFVQHGQLTLRTLLHTTGPAWSSSA